MNYYISKTIHNTTIREIRPKVEEELRKEGFGVLTEIDIQATMKKKLDKDYLPHVILGACNPVFADKVLSVEPQISTLLPCNVTLRELGNGNVEIAAVDPLGAMSAVDNQDIAAYAAEIREKLSKVVHNI
ncbi:MAG: DUF302 domain-containing protein [Flavobacteriales bacterium]|nr:DUF302 domain-containing protein [Flavobacteriales bacterium]